MLLLCCCCALFPSEAVDARGGAVLSRKIPSVSRSHVVIVFQAGGRGKKVERARKDCRGAVGGSLSARVSDRQTTN